MNHTTPRRRKNFRFGPMRNALDPWCLVQTRTGKIILFGFALRHPTTGGLGWLLSTEVLRFDKACAQATLRSGRGYSLGRQFDAVDVGGRGEEPRLVFELLMGDQFEGSDKLRDLDRSWLAACKAARHLGIDKSSRTRAAVEEFLNSTRNPIWSSDENSRANLHNGIGSDADFKPQKMSLQPANPELLKSKIKPHSNVVTESQSIRVADHVGALGSAQQDVRSTGRGPRPQATMWMPERSRGDDRVPALFMS